MTADVCPECKSFDKGYRMPVQVIGACIDKWHDEPAPRDATDPKLQKPAKVGGAIFGCGVSERLVIEAAQRNYAYNDEDAKLTPDERQQRERYRRELWDSIHGSPQSSPAEPVSATPIEPVALRHFTGSSTIATEYHDVTPAVLEGKVWEIDPAWERLYSQQSIDNLLRKLAEAKQDAARFKSDYEQACHTVARMHEAATGIKGEGPKRGVVEDCEDVRKRAESAEARAAELQAKLAAAQQWRPIESAPRNGTKILIKDKSGAVFAAWWDKEYRNTWDEVKEEVIAHGAWTDGAVKSFSYEETHSYEPTGWLPLPPSK